MPLFRPVTRTPVAISWGGGLIVSAVGETEENYPPSEKPAWRVSRGGRGGIPKRLPGKRVLNDFKDMSRNTEIPLYPVATRIPMDTGWDVGLMGNAAREQERAYPPSEKPAWRVSRGGCGRCEKGAGTVPLLLALSLFKPDTRQKFFRALYVRSDLLDNFVPV